MTSLWTPDGEHPVPPRNTPEPPAPAAPGQPGSDGGQISAADVASLAESLGVDPASLTPEQEAELREAAAEMAAARERLAQAPANEVIANHLMGMYELAAIHLGRTPPDFPSASLAIDALRSVLDGLGDRLGEPGPVLRQALGQLQMAFVRLSGVVAAGSPGEAADRAGGGDEQGSPPPDAGAPDTGSPDTGAPDTGA